MSAIADHAENLLLDWLLTTDSVTRPTTWYIALYTAAPNDAGGGTEVSTGGYARQAITFGSAASGTASNTNQIDFTASGAAYGTVTHAGVFDAVSSGNLLFHGALAASKTIDDGDTLQFSVGNFQVSLD